MVSEIDPTRELSSAWLRSMLRSAWIGINFGVLAQMLVAILLQILDLTNMGHDQQFCFRSSIVKDSVLGYFLRKEPHI